MKIIALILFFIFQGASENSLFAAVKKSTPSLGTWNPSCDSDAGGGTKPNVNDPEKDQCEDLITFCRSCMKTIEDRCKNCYSGYRDCVYYWNDPPGTCDDHVVWGATDFEKNLVQAKNPSYCPKEGSAPGNNFSCEHLNEN